MSKKLSVIKSAAYDAGTGILTIEIQNIGANSFAAEDVDVEKLSLSTPDGNNSYKPEDNPQGISVAAESFTITITLSETDKNEIAELLEKASSTNLTLSAEKDWIDNDDLTAGKQENISVTVSNNVAANESEDTIAPAAPVITTSDGLTNDATPTIEGTAEAGTTVTLYEGDTALGSAQADSGGNWSITANPKLDDGTYTLTAKAVDAAGNSSPASDSIAITIDIPTKESDKPKDEQPELTITGSTYDAATGILVISTGGYDIGADNPGNSEDSFKAHPQKLTFSENDWAYDLFDKSDESDIQAAVTIVNSSTIQIQLNATDKIAINERLKTGTTYSLSADKNWATGEGFKAEDVEDSSLVISNLPDTTPPDTPQIITGSSITNDATPTFIGTGESGATVTLFNDADKNGVPNTEEILGTAAVTNGAWSITSSPLAEDSYSTIKAIQTDIAGNASAASESISITIDTTPPGITLSNVAFSNDTGIAGDWITAAGTQIITADLNASLGASDIVYGSVNNGANWEDITGTVTGTSLSWDKTLTASGTLKLKVTDSAGNDGSILSQVYVLDQAKPDAPGSFATPRSVTNDTTPAFIGSGENGASVTLFNDANQNGVPDTGEILGTAAVTNGAWSITSSPLAEDSYSTIKTIQTDIAGNASAASESISITIDTTPPSITLSNVAFSDDTGIAGDLITKAETQTVTATLSQSLDGGDIVQGSVDGINWTTASVSGNTITWTNVTLTAGDHTLQLKVVDKAGNSGSILEQSYTLDQVAPESSQPVLDRGVPDTPSTPITADNITNNTTPSFIGFGEEGATVTLFVDTDDDDVLDADEELGTTKVANGIWTITTPKLGAGKYVIKAIQTDIAGNASAASTALPVTIDLTPPDITFRESLIKSRIWDNSESI